LESVFFKRWKIKFLKSWLDRDFQIYSALKAAKRALNGARAWPQKKRNAAEEYRLTRERRVFYATFGAWAHLTRVAEKQNMDRARKFRKGFVFARWVGHICRKGEHLERVLKA